jgi:hypothetical protein
MRRTLVFLGILSWTVQPDVAVPRDPFHPITLCTPYPITTGRRVAVSNGEDLQRALDDARAGDNIVLTAGSVFRPPQRSFTLRNRQIPVGHWVVIRSAAAAFDAGGAVPPNTRVGKDAIGAMPQIRATTDNAPAVLTEPGARGYRLVGLDIGGDPSLVQLTNLVDLREGSSDVVIDRCYLHGNDSGNFRRAVVVNGARLAVIDSYIENFHDTNTDSQAIGGATGPGPYKIVNNFLEAASESIMFGGSDPATQELVPTDIEIRRNLSSRRLAWRDAGTPVKNAFELKNARRVLVEGNVFEHVWRSGQDGTAIVLKSANQDGGCPWCVTEYVIFRDNVIRGAAHGVIINAAETGRRGLPMPRRANHIRIENVLFEDVGGPDWGGGGKLFRVFGGVSDTTFTHITSRGNPLSILDPGDASDVNANLVFKYNIVERKYYGIGAGGDEGEKTLTRNFPSFSYDQNVIVNTSAGTEQAIDDGALERRYPTRTWVVHGWDAVGFTAGDSRLTATSRFHRAASDGKDIGVDLDAIAAAQNGPADSVGCATATPRPRPPFFAARW